VQPSVRPDVYEAYWRFAAERQAIFHRRARGEPAPWTADEVLARFKFCNAYRASDRVSQYLIRRVIYDPSAQDLPAEDVFLRVVLFRLFSKEDTWEALDAITGGVRRATLQVDLLGDLLDELRQQRSIYTAAFILAPKSAYGQKPKHRNHLALVHDMFRAGGLGSQIARAKTLRDVYEALVTWPMIGPFMGYQLATDLNYTAQLSFSEDDFTVPGPGAVRGLHKVFSDFGGLSASQLIMRMVDRQEEEFDRLGIDFEDLFGRRLHAIDCQGLFCETDKMSRIRFPDLKSNRVRIKQKFRPSPTALRLFYPPKWGINNALKSMVADRQLTASAVASHRQPYQMPLIAQTSTTRPTARRGASGPNAVATD
jgi:hypothetical protein